MSYHHIDTLMWLETLSLDERVGFSVYGLPESAVSSQGSTVTRGANPPPNRNRGAHWCEGRHES